jgi:ankyrin repeat protein
MTCQRCHTVRYCQKSCQAFDWKRKDGRSHRRICDDLRDVGEASGSASQPNGILIQDDKEVEEDAENLLVACCEGNLSNVKSLLESGVDPNHACQDHLPPLHGMCAIGNAEIVSALLSNSADPNFVAAGGQTALHMACQHGHISAAKALVLSDADVCAADNQGVTALHMACHNGDYEMVLELFSRLGPNIEVDKDGNTALDYAREAGHDSLANFVAEMNERRRGSDDDEDDAVKLLNACRKGNVSDITSLLVDGVDPNHACQDHEPPLFCIWEEGRVDVVSALLSNGAKPNLRDVSGGTFLHTACQKGDIAVAKALILWKADVFAANNAGLTVLHMACYYGHTTLSEFLIDHHVDLMRVVDTQGKTALDYARNRGHDDIVKLIEAIIKAGVGIAIAGVGRESKAANKNEEEVTRSESASESSSAHAGSASGPKVDEADFGQNLPGSLDVEGMAIPSEIKNADAPKVIVAALQSSGIEPGNRVEELELEVVALKQRLQQGQTELSDLRQMHVVTFGESQKVQQRWEEATEFLGEATAALTGSKKEVSELKSALVAKRDLFEQTEKQHTKQMQSALAEQEERLERVHRRRHQQDLQEQKSLQKVEANKALAEQKQKLEQRQEQRLKKARENSELALQTAIQRENAALALQTTIEQQQKKMQQEYQRKQQEELQHHQSMLRWQAEKAKKTLDEQKQKLKRQEQILKQTRAEAASALETARNLHENELDEAVDGFAAAAGRNRLEQGRATSRIQQLIEELQAAHTLIAELNAVSSPAVMSAAEQLPGLGDTELRDLEEAVRIEYTRRQQLTLEREKEEMRKTMRAELEQEHASQRECAICLDREIDTALNCGHQACFSCASELANCYNCRQPITTRTRLY